MYDKAIAQSSFFWNKHHIMVENGFKKGTRIIITNHWDHTRRDEFWHFAIRSECRHFFRSSSNLKVNIKHKMDEWNCAREKWKIGNSIN